MLPISLHPFAIHLPACWVSSNPDILVFMGAWQSQVLGKRFRRLLLRTHHQSKDCLYLEETLGALNFKHFTAFHWTGPLSQTDCSRTSVYKNLQLRAASATPSCWHKLTLTKNEVTVERTNCLSHLCHIGKKSFLS